MDGPCLMFCFSRGNYVYCVVNREAILRCSEAAGYQLGRRKKVRCVTFDAAFYIAVFFIATCYEVTAVGVVFIFMIPYLVPS